MDTAATPPAAQLSPTQPLSTQDAFEPAPVEEFDAAATDDIPAIVDCMDAEVDAVAREAIELAIRASTEEMVQQDWLLSSCLPTTPADRDTVLDWLGDEKVADAKTFVLGYFARDLYGAVLEARNRAKRMHRAREDARARVRASTLQASSSFLEKDEAVRVLEKRNLQEFEVRAIKAQRLLVTSGPSAPGPATNTDQSSRLAEALLEVLRSCPTSPKAVKLRDAALECVDDFEKSIRTRLMSFSDNSLSGALRAWRRWVTFLERSFGDATFEPADPVVMTIFLEYVGQGNPKTHTGRQHKSAGGQGAESLRNSLASLENHPELRLAMRDPDVIAAGAAAPARRQRRTERFKATDVLALTKLTECRNELVTFLAQGVLVTKRGGVRIRHAQRSTLVSSDKSGAIFFCA